ncbi:MAG: hypothetical protein Q9168_006979 [Polycauliona sp. 1 TL-2023]
MGLLINSSKPLDPNDLYICAIEASYHWSTDDWEEPTQTHLGQSAIIRGLQVSFHDTPNPPTEMYWKHIILAILTSLNTMNQRQEYAEAVVQMKQFGKVFGLLRIGKPATTTIVDNGVNKTYRITPSTMNSNATAADHNNTTLASASASASASTPANHRASKTITDPEFSEGLGILNITYQRFGARVPCTLLFSTALDGIAFMATDDHGDTWPFSTAYDWSHKMVYQTVEVATSTGGSSWTANLIARAARLLPQQLFADDDCGEVRFRTEAEGYERVGTGSFQVVDFERQRVKGVSRMIE